MPHVVPPPPASLRPSSSAHDLRAFSQAQSGVLVAEQIAGQYVELTPLPASAAQTATWQASIGYHTDTLRAEASSPEAAVKTLLDKFFEALVADAAKLALAIGRNCTLLSPPREQG